MYKGVALEFIDNQEGRLVSGDIGRGRYPKLVSIYCEVVTGGSGGLVKRPLVRRFGDRRGGSEASQDFRFEAGLRCWRDRQDAKGSRRRRGVIKA